MWNRRDFVLMGAVAAATFGVTVAAVYPRLANAVDRAPAATVDVKTPALVLGNAQVTAARDDADPQTIVFTIANAGEQPTKVEFLAQVMEMPSGPSASRSLPAPQPIWGQELSSNVKGGETKTIKVSLPSSITKQNVVAEASPANSKAAAGDTKNAKAGKAAPVTAKAQFLELAGKDDPKRKVTVLPLTPSVPVVQVAVGNVVTTR